ncbi:hypothetical protein FRACYDRAFT_248179 [Fragilariopsis cylindrus CCMP1102]|uniref:DUF1995 domain-containing protein n=1 Tax=Fragilariopsis cylindrus CCMP1102 TaxID=635003 RepID=A0A1E7EV83_9STRA|nr:hypothetical protein FRACYDRAFT_248179 [Fragilariopsis cylindrus CCMP1102]|eukprot:OEU09928.1 hypothetical protein FRACYDRAFT_248179 [Fragilariopsis cylindrus CCMP1102]
MTIIFPAKSYVLSAPPLKMMISSLLMLMLVILIAVVPGAQSLIPFLDGGKDIPKLYNGYFDSQIAKQAATAVGAAISSGKKNIEVNLPAVPNLEEVKFGTPLNQKFSKTIVTKDLKVKGGYYPGSDIARQQLSYANMYWAKQISGAVSGGIGGIGGKSVTVLSAEPLDYELIKNKGGMNKIGPIRTGLGSGNKKDTLSDACIVINPGGEETWDRLRQSLTKNKNCPFVVLNNAYSTTYGLGNKRKYEEAYYLKRITKGWIYRAYPGPWKAYLEAPDGSTELLKTFNTKPELRVAAELVREESFKRYAISNDRWMSGRM